MNTEELNQISEEEFSLYENEVDEAEMPAGISFIDDDGNQIPVWIDPNPDVLTGDEETQFTEALAVFREGRYAPHES